MADVNVRRLIESCLQVNGFYCTKSFARRKFAITHIDEAVLATKPYALHGIVGYRVVSINGTEDFHKWNNNTMNAFLQLPVRTMISSNFVPPRQKRKLNNRYENDTSHANERETEEREQAGGMEQPLRKKRAPQNRHGRKQDRTGRRQKQNREGREQNREGREQNREDRRVEFMSIEQRWTKRCQHCGCSHLHSATSSMLRNCCDNARLADGGELQEYYKLEELTPNMQEMMIMDTEHFSCLSSSYNNMFAFGTVCVENDHGGGFEKRVGAHAVTICGRTYSYIPRANSGSACRSEWWSFIFHFRF